KDYQLWAVDAEHKDPISAGVVRVDKNGVAQIRFKPVEKAEHVKAFAISLEREGGVPKKKGPILLVGTARTFADRRSLSSYSFEVGGLRWRERLSRTRTRPALGITSVKENFAGAMHPAPAFRRNASRRPKNGNSQTTDQYARSQLLWKILRFRCAAPGRCLSADVFLSAKE